MSDNCYNALTKEFDAIKDLLYSINLSNQLETFDKLNKIQSHLTNMRTFYYADALLKLKEVENASGD